MNSVQKYIGGNKPSDSLKNYMRAAGYDVDKWDDADVRRNGMAILGGARGNGLSDDDYGRATTELQRYLSLGAGQDAYQQSVADAENEAKRKTAYNEYLNARVASYLGEIEGAAGQKGYTGTTEGNRIALQNTIANRQQAISDDKQAAKSSAVSEYLKVADKANADYFNNMDLTESASQSRRDTQVQNVKGEIESAMTAVSGSLEGVDDETVTRLRDYIKGYKFDNEDDRQRVLSWYNSLYGEETEQAQAESGEALEAGEGYEPSSGQASTGATKQSANRMTSAEFYRHGDLVKEYGSYENYLTGKPSVEDKRVSFASESPTSTAMKVAKGQTMYVTNPYPSSIEIGQRVDLTSDLYRALKKKNPSATAGTVVEHEGKLYALLQCKDKITVGWEPQFWFEVSKR